MKKSLNLLLIFSLLVAITVFLTGCGNNDWKMDDDTKTITIAASPTPHAEILQVAKEILKEEGYTLIIKEFNDYIIPNNVTESGEVNCNFFQHKPYLDNFNEENGTHLVSVASIHYEPFGIYAGKSKSIESLPDGAKIAVPNDGTNEARALLLLEEQGLITLREGAGFTATKLDIEMNPHNYEIVEVEAATIPQILKDVEIGVINGNYAIGAGLKVSEAIAIEASDSQSALTYANILVVHEGNEDNKAILALINALQSDCVKSYIDETYEGAVIPLF